jgi:hypothetical protein
MMHDCPNSCCSSTNHVASPALQLLVVSAGAGYYLSCCILLPLAPAAAAAAAAAAHLHEPYHDCELPVALDELLGAIQRVNHPAVLVVLQPANSKQQSQHWSTVHTTS